MKKLASLTSVIGLATTGERTPTPAAAMAAAKRLTLTARSEVSGAIAKAIGQERISSGLSAARREVSGAIAKAVGQTAPLAALAGRDEEAEAECDEEIVRRLGLR